MGCVPLDSADAAGEADSDPFLLGLFCAAGVDCPENLELRESIA
jgi:hypothetical protein